MQTDGGKVGVFVVYSTLLLAPEGCRPLNIPASPAAAFGSFICLGGGGHDRQAYVLSDLVPLSLRLPSSSVSPTISSSLSWIRFDAFTSYPSHPFYLFPDTDISYRHRREREERDLPEQLCTLKHPRLIHHSRLTCFVLLAFRSC